MFNGSICNSYTNTNIYNLYRTYKIRNCYYNSLRNTYDNSIYGTYSIYDCNSDPDDNTNPQSHNHSLTFDVAIREPLVCIDQSARCEMYRKGQCGHLQM